MSPFSRVVRLAVSLVAVGACAPDSSLGPEPGGRVAAEVSASLNQAGTPAGITIHDDAYSAETILEGLTTPQGIMGRGRGLTFVGISETGEILRVTPGGSAEVHAQIPLLPGRTRKGLVHLVFKSDGGMYATDIRQGAVFNVDSDGAVSLFASTLLAPNQVDFDSQGRIYVSENTGQRVSRLAPDGSRSTVVQLSFPERPTGLAIDESDNLFIFSGATGRIWRFALGGAEPATFTSLELVATVPGMSATKRGDNMAFGPDGDLFAITTLDMYRVGLDGTTSLFVSGLNGPFNSVSASSNNDLLVTEFADSTAAGRAFRIRPAHR